MTRKERTKRADSQLPGSGIQSNSEIPRAGVAAAQGDRVLGTRPIPDPDAPAQAAAGASRHDCAPYLQSFAERLRHIEISLGVGHNSVPLTARVYANTVVLRLVLVLVLAILGTLVFDQFNFHFRKSPILAVMKCK